VHVGHASFFALLKARHPQRYVPRKIMCGDRCVGGEGVRQCILNALHFSVRRVFCPYSSPY